VSSSKFAYFFFKSGESYEGRQQLLVHPLALLLSHIICHKLCWWERGMQLISL